MQVLTVCMIVGLCLGSLVAPMKHMASPTSWSIFTSHAPTPPPLFLQCQHKVPFSNGTEEDSLHTYLNTSVNRWIKVGRCRRGATAAWNFVQVGLLMEMLTPPTFLARHLPIDNTWTGVTHQPGKNFMDAGQRSILLPTQTPSAEDETVGEYSRLSTRSAGL